MTTAARRATPALRLVTPARSETPKPARTQIRELHMALRDTWQRFRSESDISDRGIARGCKPAQCQRSAPAFKCANEVLGRLLATRPLTLLDFGLKSVALDHPLATTRLNAPKTLRSLSRDMKRLYGPSPLKVVFDRAMTLEAEAEAADYTADGDTWLGAETSEHSERLLDVINTTPCRSHGDAVLKIEAVCAQFRGGRVAMPEVAESMAASLESALEALRMAPAFREDVARLSAPVTLRQLESA